MRVPTDEAARPKLQKHRHADLTGGKTSQCQVYPRAFCQAVCEGIAAQKRLHSLGLRAEPLMNIEEMMDALPEELKNGTGCPSKDLHDDDGGYTLEDGTVAFDDQSGAPLKPELMRQARRDEIDYFKKMNVYQKVPVHEAWQETGKGPIGVRWVDINKGDEDRPNYRSRLVAKEFKDDVRPELYAATPPSECLRLMISRMASARKLQMM